MIQFTLNQKHLICHVLLRLWESINAISQMDLQYHEILQNKEIMSEIMALSIKIRHYPPVKYTKGYKIELSDRERFLLSKALEHSFANPKQYKPGELEKIKSLITTHQT